MLAVVGGSGWESFPGLTNVKQLSLDTPYGPLAEPLSLADWNGQSLIFLSRHGAQHSLAPHQINYRANVWALREVGVQQVLAINAVGGIGREMGPGTLVVPSQLIDYTWGRAHSFWSDQVLHIDFGNPFEGALRSQILSAAKSLGVALLDGGTYGCTQGPRLETAAEIRRLAQDGCELVGMTAMPEAALARELALDYASLCIVVNWAAGISDERITMEAIYQVLEASRAPVQGILGQLLRADA
ncbi:S-methyl-5'-thioinosine phosphorylase [Simiduia aestuariiviva]|uniref:Probable S-methyl-5'-thioinosine phosphorylase n=1 Tax=Simiduia aestuariiviva TaxID=1510459 RepID=A0A839ULG9_9GAMM|nr:S-methyl-5'-thioinosine phosphorylase [Simiduia aestuariiviva]MBB3168513.1 5'-deoxy-5'-methylthioadenosine phosphorylase [Simiduia aestuariiviva]